MKEPLVQKYWDLIRLLAGLKYSSRKKLIEKFKKPHINCLSEIFKNLLRNKLPVPSKVLKKLKKYSSLIRVVACKKPSTAIKKKILTSKRGGNILSILLPIAVNLLSRLFTK